MQAPAWLVITGLVAATAMAARTEATTVDANPQDTAERGMDVIVVTAKRSAGRPSADALASATAPDTSEGFFVQLEGSALGIGMPSESELFARAQEAVQEAIQNIEVSLGRPDDLL